MGRKPTSIEVELDIADAVLKQGLPQHVVAADFHVSQSTVSRIKRKYELAEKHEEERMEKTIAGNTKTGTLKATGNDVYTGTCVLPNGRTRKKVFRATGSKNATSQWERWCEQTRAEHEEREPEPFAKVDITPAPVPEIVVTRKAHAEPVAENPRPEVETDEQQVEEHVEEKTQPKVEGPVYAIVIGEPKIAGYLTDMEQAFRIEATMNAALEFAGVDVRYQVVEVERYREA